jgi:hypothetical protein
MCLVVCTDSGVDADGEIRRIDFKDNAVRGVSEKLGYGNYPRFSPTGTAFAYISGTTATICELDGTIKNSFPVAEAGKLSYTLDGIYIGGVSNSSSATKQGKIYLYDTAGAKKWEKTFDYCGGAFVSQNGKTATSVVRAAGSDGATSPRVAIADVQSGASILCGDEQGCSACPSPDGTMLTQNIGGAFDHCHLEMRIRRADGSRYLYYYLKDITGLDLLQHWCWNTQKWSGNSQQWIMLPVGQTNRTSGCSQLDLNCSPWIYNIVTGEVYQLAERTGDFWMPCDYFSGAVYEPPLASFSVAPVSIQFSADSGVSNIAGQTVTVRSAAGGLPAIALSPAPSWLTIEKDIFTDTMVSLHNTVTTSGMKSGTYNAAITVSAPGAASKTYSVILTINPTIPPLRVLYPNGGEQLQVGQYINLRWEFDTTAVSSMIVEVSVDAGKQWQAITDINGIGSNDLLCGAYPWNIPSFLRLGDGDSVSSVSSQCLIRVSEYINQSISDRSDNAFSISASSPAQPFRDRVNGLPRVRNLPGGTLGIDIPRCRNYEITAFLPDGSTISRQSGQGPAELRIQRKGISHSVAIIRCKIDFLQYEEVFIAHGWP